MSKRISRTLETTKFKGVPIVSVSAKPGGQEVCIIIMTVELTHAYQYVLHCR